MIDLGQEVIDEDLILESIKIIKENIENIVLDPDD